MLYTKVINDNKNFVEMYNKAGYFAGKYIVLYVKSNNLPYNRFGITAGKKVGNAVRRNRAKRLIRQVYSDNEVNLPIGIDIVIVARYAICDINYTQLNNFMTEHCITEIMRLAKRVTSRKKK